MHERDIDELRPHPLHWAIEPLLSHATYFEKPMFGCRACYLFGQLKLVLAAHDEEPWQGVLIATDRVHHESLLNEFPPLVSHPVLGKWLYAPEDLEEFESLLQGVTKLVLRNDTRIGVEPGEKKKRRKRPKRKAKNSASKNR